MPGKKIIHPLLGEVDIENGPAILDEHTSIVPNEIPPAFVSSPIINSPPEQPKPEPEPIKKKLKRELINLARRALDRWEKK